VSTQEDLVRAIVAAGVRGGRLIDAFREVPRAGFVPTELVERAYLDRPLPIPHGQVTTQPSLSAKMIEALALTDPERVLEVGTGYGFQTALLACLSGFVWSVERFPDVAATARENLARQGIENVEVVAGDGTRGLPEHAPYDATLVSAAFTSVPPPLLPACRPGSTRGRVRPHERLRRRGRGVGDGHRISLEEVWKTSAESHSSKICHPLPSSFSHAASN
jgi:protein-L-isoaspartate(D-aspartate) O-methyltransferase